MPKISTFPTLLDEVKQISITNLKKWGYLNGFKGGRLIWSRNGEEVGSINITVSMYDEPHAKLSYNCNGEPVDYRINLVSIPSNLGVGKIWYFKCPATGQRCRKLYGAGKYFLHRDAYPDAMYESQTYSKYGRMIDKVCKIMNGSDKLYEELYSKHFKTHYAGKPTKRYKQILSELEYIRQNEAQALKFFQRELYR